MEISGHAGSCMDAPVHASSSSNDFGRVIGCGHVSGLLCGLSTTAGRYGATRTWCKISSTSSWLTDPDAFPDPLSPIFVLTVRWPPHTPTIRPDLSSTLATLQAVRNPCNLRFWSSLPRWIEPFYSRGRSQRACAVCAPAFVPATSSRVELSGMPIE